MTNKENSRPPNAKADMPAVVEKEAGREMPLGEVFLDHRSGPMRNIPSWILDEESLYTAKDNSLSFRNRGEYSEINRLLANCDINHENTMADDRPPKELSLSNLENMENIENIENMANIENNLANISHNDSGTALSISADSLEIKEEKPDMASSTIQDDTLEEIEYVLDRGLHYVPVKNNKNSNENRDTTSSAENKSDNEIICIDSSPENSFNTARNNFDGRSVMTTADSSYATARDVTSTTRYWSGSATETGKKSMVMDKSSMEYYTINTSEESTECPMSQQNKSASNSTALSHNEASSADSGETLEEMPDFNCTLDRIEYMMERGQKLIAQQSMSTVKAPVTPTTVKAPLTPTTVKETPSTSYVKRAQTPTSVKKNAQTEANKTPSSASRKPPQSKALPTFKKPEGRPSPSPLRPKHAPPMAGGSRIPQLKTQYADIKSPIAAYIKNTPQVPLIKTVKPMSKFFDTNIYGKGIREHDMSIQSTSREVVPANTKPTLPRKVYKAASQQKVSSTITTNNLKFTQTSFFIEYLKVSSK